MAEFKAIPESRVLIVDDNLIGRKPEHIERAKELFRALAEADTGKTWIGQTTVNFADDEDSYDLGRGGRLCGPVHRLRVGYSRGSSRAGQKVGHAVGQKSLSASVGRIRCHNIMVAGSFIMGLDSDRPGVGRLIAEAATEYGVDNMNVLFLTPLPGTQIWKQFKAEGRLSLTDFPEDWTVLHPQLPGGRLQVPQPRPGDPRDD